MIVRDCSPPILASVAGPEGRDANRWRMEMAPQDFIPDMGIGGWLVAGFALIAALALAARFRYWIAAALCVLMLIAQIDTWLCFAFPAFVSFVLSFFDTRPGAGDDDDPDGKGYDYAEEAAWRNDNWHWHHDPYK